VRFAIAIPQGVPDGAFDAAAMREYLRRAEELGFASGWTQQQILGTAPQLGPAETLAYAAACTQHLRLGCAVLVTPLHSPVHLAKSLSTLDQLTGGRLDVGIGVGGRGREFAAFGLEPDGFVSRFTEGLRLMQKLWSEPRVTFHGRFWQLDDAAMEPKPVQRPGPPVWFGGSHPDALQRAVRLGDGFIGAGSVTTEQFASQVGTVRRELAAQDRDPASFPIAKRVYVAVDDDAARARQQLGAALDELYGLGGSRDMTPVTVTGRPADCVRGLREVAAAGAGLILLNPLTDQAEQMERLAAEVMPELG
jgi:probable F420-dependent oxidoreductase